MATDRPTQQLPASPSFEDTHGNRRQKFGALDDDTLRKLIAQGRAAQKELTQRYEHDAQRMRYEIACREG